MTAKRRQPNRPEPAAASTEAECAVVVASDPEVPSMSWVMKAPTGSAERARRQACFAAYYVDERHSSNRHSIGQEDVGEGAKVYQMQLWPDTKRAMPTDFIACALFAAVQMKHAPRLRGAHIASINGFTISVTGQRLTQVHADVLMGIAHLAREEPQGYIARFSHRAFLRLIGREHGSNSLKSLRQLLDDLMGTVIRITYPNGRSLSGHVLEKSADDGQADNSQFAVKVTRELCEVYTVGFALVDWDQRIKLKKRPLALWLQLYFSQFHRPVEVRELHRLSGSSDGLRFFRRRLKHELGTLETIGALRQWYVDESDVVHIAPSGQPLPARFQQHPESAPALQAALPSPTPPIGRTVPDKAIAEFQALYPSLDVEKCIAAWHVWPGSLQERLPGKLFLTFAKAWAAEQPR